MDENRKEELKDFLMVLWRTSEIGSAGSGTKEAKENYKEILSIIDRV